MNHLVPGAHEPALAPAFPIAALETAAAITAVAEALQPDLAQRFQIDALRLRIEIERAFRGFDSMGLWDLKLADEACEVTLVLFLRKFIRALLVRAGSNAALLPVLAKVANLHSTHTRRSEEMQLFQHSWGRNEDLINGGFLVHLID